MHGARNDFVVLDRRSDGRPDLTRFARWACDRQAGIGADGVIAIESSSAADVRMRTINSDGSEAEMCGNGIRCAARWLDEAGDGGRLAFETAAGLVSTEIVSRAPQYAVRVSMGRPSVGEIALATGEKARFVDLGNPHVVLVRPDVDAFDLERAALELQKDARFKRGVNVHVMMPRGARSVRVRHWERGVGLTLACGTGAVACATVALRDGAAAAPVEVFVPGGRLVVEFNTGGDTYLTGPAVRVFDAEVEYDDDAAL
jgi:diaminopimelate epimerase